MPSPQQYQDQLKRFQLGTRKVLFKHVAQVEKAITEMTQVEGILAKLKATLNTDINATQAIIKSAKKRGPIATLLWGENKQALAPEAFQEQKQLLAAYQGLKKSLDETTAQWIKLKQEAVRWLKAHKVVIPVAKKSYVDYYAYIRSHEWRRRAERAKQRAGHRCQVCNRPEKEIVLNAHHRTYERLGNELPEDITVLCRDCHYTFERNKKEQTYVVEQRVAMGDGVCIRCKTLIPLNRQKPYCDDCYLSWKRYKNLTYKENYCHVCSQTTVTSFMKPVCGRCYGKYKTLLHG